MKKQILNIFTIVALGLSFVACKDDAKKVETSDSKAVKEVSVDSKYTAIPSKSMVIWKANKIVGGHEGTINLSGGTAKFTNNKLVGGTFTFDIKTLKCTDIPAEQEENGKLVGHLMGEDFFNAEVFGTAKFEITNVEETNVSGNLTLKGITKNVTFPAEVSMKDDTVMITSDMFTIDRTEFDINYNSGRIMDAAKLGDYLIKDDVELKINVTAKKA